MMDIGKLALDKLWWTTFDIDMADQSTSATEIRFQILRHEFQYDCKDALRYDDKTT